MRLRLPFRLTRGVTVLIIIVLAHLTIAALFMAMRVEVPEMGPVFATILDESADSDRESAKTPSNRSRAAELRGAPAEGEDTAGGQRDTLEPDPARSAREPARQPAREE